jgi:hypothetical protein
MMETYFQVYYDLLNNLYTEMESLLKDISQEALDWSPGVDMNSIAVMAAHTAGATRFLIGEMVGGKSFDRNRPAEFETAEVSAGDLSGSLHVTMEVCKSVLEDLRLGDLLAVRIHPRDGKEHTVAWCLGHALEHFAQHLGHMQITLQMWDMQNI